MNAEAMSRRKTKWCEMAEATIEWLGARSNSAKLNSCLGRVLSELRPWALLELRDKHLQVEISEEEDKTKEFSVWAYFPMHRHRIVTDRFKLKPLTRVLLVLSQAQIQKKRLMCTKQRLCYLQILKS